MISDTSVGIVTVTYNSEGVLEDFLKSLLCAYIPSFKLYVIDNASADRTLEILDQYRDRVDICVIANESNVGVAAGNNQGIAAALREGAAWVLLLNNDTVIPAITVHGLVETARDRGLHIVSPIIEGTLPAGSIWYEGGSITPFQGMKVRHQNIGSSIANTSPGLRGTEYAPACCLLVHRSVFRRIGGMDTDYFVYFDDVDFAIRAKAAGYPYWVSGDHKIIHKASSLTGGYLSPFTVRWLSRNWVLTARKHCSLLQRCSAYSYMQLWMFARVALRRDTWSVYRLRQRSFLEGLRAPMAAAGRDDDSARVGATDVRA